MGFFVLLECSEVVRGGYLGCMMPVYCRFWQVLLLAGRFFVGFCSVFFRDLDGILFEVFEAGGGLIGSQFLLG